MSDDFFSNLQAVTSNIEDITFSRFATITSITGNYATVKEDESELEHTNVPLLNGVNLSVGDKVILGFVDNSIYNPVILAGGEEAYTKTETEALLQKKINEPINEGSNGQVLTTDGQGGRTWKTVQGGGSDVDIVTSWEPTPSDTKVPSEKLTKDTLDTKVDKVTGKGLSANDFTNSYKNTIDGLSTVATTGDYDDLTDKPTIPSKISDLTNDSNFIEKSSTNGLVKNDGSVDTTQYLSSLPSHNHDDRYYTESEVDTALNGKQATLISGTNIKTINNNSLLGSGNISISTSGTVDSALSTTSTNPVENQAITNEINSLSTSITNIGSFEKVAENTTYELWVNTTTRCARIICHRTNITIGSGESFNNYGDFKIPSAYRPKKSFYRLIMRSNQFIFYLYDNGSYGIYNTGSSVSGYNINFQIDYTF